MKQGSILLVEDDYLDVESVKRTFKKSNIHCSLHVAHNGADALEMLTGEKNRITPDIILLDINMPKMNGLEFVRIIKNYFSLKNIKIFIITTSGEEYDRIAAENVGVDGYILKPLDFKNPTSPDTERLMEEIQRLN